LVEKFVSNVAAIPVGLYHVVQLYGIVKSAVPDYYSLHYEIFVACPKCSGNLKECGTEYASVRSGKQKSGRVNPVLNLTATPITVTMEAVYNISDQEFSPCGNKPEIIVKRVAKINVMIECNSLLYCLFYISFIILSTVY
jgi:hypothetical protein